ncbi:hypothetical protein [Puia sp.]|jgi:hypothetical protein|uniref:hypothetical protein n=1 Tax=Puia sp. TaxID=2045100 RepID=UPI002F41EAD6
MKIRLTLAAVLLVLALGTKAQPADSTRTSQGRAAALTEKMKTELSLTDDQYPQVQAINQKYVQRNQEIWTGADGRFAKFKALKSSQKDKDKEMKAILDKDQYKKYETMKEEMKAKAREEYKGRQGQ